MLNTLKIVNYDGNTQTFNNVRRYEHRDGAYIVFFVDRGHIEISDFAVLSLELRPGPTVALSFSAALVAMKNGARIRRAGWNGKGMWLCLGEGNTQTADKFWNEHTREFAENQPDKRAKVLPYVIMKTADDAILMGWLASQSDMLAEDWEIVE